MKEQRKSAVAALVLGWLVPGGGHAYLGQRKKALFIFVILIGAFAGGVAIAGYDDVVFPAASPNTPASDITSQAMNRIIPLVQAMNGGVAFVTAWAMRAAPRDNQYLGDYDIGLLYTVIAGLMNLIVLLDGFCRAAREPRGGSS